eukprot:364980-Chlamydomonas_euryale.AAC.8
MAMLDRAATNMCATARACSSPKTKRAACAHEGTAGWHNAGGCTAGWHNAGGCTAGWHNAGGWATRLCHQHGEPQQRWNAYGVLPPLSHTCATSMEKP